MRIIAGSAGGIALEPAPKGVRPTMDRTRGAIFSSLGDAVPGARILDLFAGTGALGIEALSRGATSAVFVDSNERCCHCIRRNLEKCHLSGFVQKGDAFKFLDSWMATPSASANAFDLIFADPPYDKKNDTHEETTAAAKLLCTSQAITQILSANGIFILEAFRKFELPQGCGWTSLREKRMGETLFFLLSKKAS